MSISKEEAIKALCDFAPYVHDADISLDGENFTMFDGTVKQEISSEWKVIARTERKFIGVSIGIEEFLKNYIEFSEKTNASVDPMILNSIESESYNWVINSRAYCGIAMVRYCSKKGFIKDIEKDAEKLLKLGFKLDHLKDWQYK